MSLCTLIRFRLNSFNIILISSIILGMGGMDIDPEELLRHFGFGGQGGGDPFGGGFGGGAPKSRARRGGDVHVK